MQRLSELGLLGLFIGTFLAATVLPFSSDALYLAVLAVLKQPMECLLVATLGNWLGGITTYYVGRIGKWEWMEKWFSVKRETLERQKVRVDKYGIWLALLSWAPFIGDVFVVALGFYRAKPIPTIILLLIGKFLRFLVWNWVFGLM